MVLIMANNCSVLPRHFSRVNHHCQEKHNSDAVSAISDLQGTSLQQIDAMPVPDESQFRIFQLPSHKKEET